MTKLVVLNGKKLQDYFVDEDGFIWSMKHDDLKLLVPTKGSTYSKYPRISFSVDGVVKKCLYHRVVCETLHPFPKPNGITEKQWKSTPASVKRLVTASYQVNHIDHNPLNFHSSNLEWVSVKENSQKYQAHRRAKQ